MLGGHADATALHACAAYIWIRKHGPLQCPVSSLPIVIMTSTEDEFYFVDRHTEKSIAKIQRRHLTKVHQALLNHWAMN